MLFIPPIILASPSFFFLLGHVSDYLLVSVYIHTHHAAIRKDVHRHECARKNRQQQHSINITNAGESEEPQIKDIENKYPQFLSRLFSRVYKGEEINEDKRKKCNAFETANDRTI